MRSTNWIGDAVMTMPAIQRLRELEPHAQITLLCAAKLRDLWRHNPYLSEVIAFEREPDLDQLRAREFDLAVLLPQSFRSAWEAYRAGIPHRVGYPGHGRRWLLTRVAPEPAVDRPRRRKVSVTGTHFRTKHFPQVRHQVHHYLDLIGYLGGNSQYADPKIWLAPEELPLLTRFFTDDGRPVLALQAGAEYGPAKRWLPDRFADVAIEVAQHTDCRWLLVGGKGDVEITQQIEARLRAARLPAHDVINVAGQTTLLELFALFRFCRLLLTNDTGPMHLAAALGTPLVAVFGSTSAELTGPLGGHCTVVHEPVECNPCFLRECPIDLRCMHRITVDQVAATVRNRLDQP
ncbi:lipopolysaccharide heptosyltransferase II [bacterium]|nr:lipopolysaccharide heptosyltransferase II [bacterium]